MDEKDNFIEPTVVQVDDVNDSLMKDEIFGPLLPIYPINDLDEAIRIANEVSHTPLALFAFGKKQETDRGKRRGYIESQRGFADKSVICSATRDTIWRCIHQ